MYLLACSSGLVIFEFYYGPGAVITDFALQHPLTFHIAFISNCAQYNWEHLEKQGAVFVEEVKKEEGT
jgi:hypothetical protein